jgi:hypothetical protein
MYRHPLRILLCIVFLFSVQAQTLEQSLLFDFGPDDQTNGVKTPSPDKNGNYWNNVTPGTSSLIILNTLNQSTTYTITESGFSYNGIKNGGLLTPDAKLLGDLGINTATEDYFYTESPGYKSLAFKNLKTDRVYKFTIFGSRQDTIKRISQYKLVGAFTTALDLQTTGKGIGDNGYDGNNNKVAITPFLKPDKNGTIQFRVSIVSGSAYINALKIEEYSGVELPDERAGTDLLKITMTGSSVAEGQMATDNQGYAYQYFELLRQRHDSAGGYPWTTQNISVGGTTTIYWNTAVNTNKIYKQNSKYVIIGLSQANEGLLNSDPETIFNQFRDGLLTLVKHCRDSGMVPVVMGNYPHNSYNANQYSYIKKINALIQGWDVPSVNLLGALDNGQGHWVDTYWLEAGHPNSLGHTELMYTIVPSMFDALHEGKKLPVQKEGTFIGLKKSTKPTIVTFTPEHTVHSFTVSIGVKTTGRGTLLSIKQNSSSGTIAIGQSDTISYTSPTNNIIKGRSSVNDGKWHTVTLTHYYALEKSFLYVDSTLLGSLNEKLLIKQCIVNSSIIPDTIDYKDWFFYRSAMTREECASIAKGSMLKSSLELYAPLDGSAPLTADCFANFALSTNKITATGPAYAVVPRHKPEAVESYLRSGNLSINLSRSQLITIEFFNVAGRQLGKRSMGVLSAGNHMLRIGNQTSHGMYIVSLKADNRKIAVFKQMQL